MTYVALSRDMNVSTSCAVSKDFKKWKRLGVIFREQNKDVVLFPETIEGKYFALNRPEGSFQFTQPDILVSSSEDLESWGRPRSLKLVKERSWDSGKLGAGPPPIKIEGGWLIIYHGIVTKNARRRKGFFGRLKSLFKEKKKDLVRYYAGVALLDLRNPSKVIKKMKDPLFSPNKSYEKSPYENKRVVFPTGLVEDLNGNDLLVYSGGGDVLVTAKKIALSEILRRLETF